MPDHIEDGAAIGQLLERGFEFPIHFAVISVNGGISAGSFEQRENGGFECKFLAEHSVEAGLQLPINIMFVDSKSGDAARVLFANPDVTLSIQ